MKRLFFGFILLSAAACSNEAVNADSKLETDEQKTLYAIGMTISNQLGVFALSEEELKPIVQGILDGIKGEEPKVDMQVYAAKINQFASDRAAVVAKQQSAASAEYLKQFEGDDSVVKTDSGAFVKMITEGSGNAPTPQNTVKVHYEGKLLDGTVFDSSYVRGAPATFGLGQVISCWTEGLQEIKTGGKAELICPADTAYGDRGAPPKIGPGATLVFQVELVEIVK